MGLLLPQADLQRRFQLLRRSGIVMPSWVLSAGGVAASLDIDFVNNRAWSSGHTSVAALLSCTRASSNGYYTNADGTLQSFASGTLRLGDNGLLCEETRTNLVLYNSAFDTPTSGANWTKTRSNITANATTAPDGTLTADLLYEDSTAASTHVILQNVAVSSGAVYTSSFYVKYAGRRWVRIIDGSTVTGSAWFDVQNGVIGFVTGTGSPSAAMQALANGWYRISVTMTTAGTSMNSQLQLCQVNGSNSYDGDGSSGVYIWGAQVEAGAYVTSVIPTTTTIYQRNSDNIAFADFSWYNQATGTLYAACLENAIGTTAGTYRIFSISTGSSSFDNYLYHFNGVPSYAITNSTTQANLSTGTISANVINKYIGAYATNDAAADFNGGTVQTDNTVNLPTPTQANLGGINGSSIGGSRYIKRIAYWNTRVSNANMQTLTT